MTYPQGKSIRFDFGIDFRKLMLQSEQNANAKQKTHETPLDIHLSPMQGANTQPNTYLPMQNELLATHFVCFPFYMWVPHADAS